jgi:predicted lipoprotein with Yx(FWY)xxD motif
MTTIKTSVAAATLVAALVLLLAACGGGGDSGTARPAPEGPAPTVSVASVDGVGDVLVDASGAALYAAEQEVGGSIACTGSCTTVWKPLTLGGAETPTAETALSSPLAVVMRPDGVRQVTFGGRPLYRFELDASSGTVTGNGLVDSFDGRDFTWHVATPTGLSTSDSNSSADAPGYNLGG